MLKAKNGVAVLLLSACSTADMAKPPAELLWSGDETVAIESEHDVLAILTSARPETRKRALERLSGVVTHLPEVARTLSLRGVALLGAEGQEWMRAEFRRRVVADKSLRLVCELGFHLVSTELSAENAAVIVWAMKKGGPNAAVAMSGLVDDFADATEGVKRQLLGAFRSWMWEKYQSRDPALELSEYNVLVTWVLPEIEKVRGRRFSSRSLIDWMKGNE